MRGWSSIFAGFLLLGVAYWSFASDGFGSSTLLCAAAAAFFFFRGAQGLEVSETGDPSALVDFVSDPAEAIVDTATDRLADWLNDDEPNSAAAAEQRELAVEAAIARYMAQRGTEQAAASVSPGPPRGFGRKGL